MRETYGKQYDSCAGDLDSPYVSEVPTELLAYDPEARWVCGSGEDGYRAGDVVIFSRHCIHGSTVNASADSVRLSSDVSMDQSIKPTGLRLRSLCGCLSDACAY